MTKPYFTTRIIKQGMIVPMTWESVTEEAPRPGHWEPDPMTKEELAEYQQVKKALKLIEKSEWTLWDHDEGWVLKDKRTRKWVYDD